MHSNKKESNSRHPLCQLLPPNWVPQSEITGHRLGFKMRLRHQQTDPTIESGSPNFFRSGQDEIA